MIKAVFSVFIFGFGILLGGCKDKGLHAIPCPDCSRSKPCDETTAQCACPPNSWDLGDWCLHKTAKMNVFIAPVQWHCLDTFVMRWDKVPPNQNTKSVIIANKYSANELALSISNWFHKLRPGGDSLSMPAMTLFTSYGNGVRCNLGEKDGRIIAGEIDFSGVWYHPDTILATLKWRVGTHPDHPLNKEKKVFKMYRLK